MNIENKNTHKTYLEHSLFFATNSLARIMNSISEKEFRKIDISPSNAYLIMLCVEEPGITQKKIAFHLNLTQSTVSRFTTTLKNKNYIAKRSYGKNVKIFPTDKGIEKFSEIQELWKNIYDQYSEILGKENSDNLTYEIYNAYKKIQKNLQDEY